VYDTSGGVARKGWGYALVERQRQGSGQVSNERTLVGLTCAPLSRRDTRQQRHRCCILSRYACYGRVRRIIVAVAVAVVVAVAVAVAVDELSRSILGAPSSLATAR